MDKLGDMDLFVRVVKNNGLAAAGREVGLSPASMSARINGLEARYNTRLLNRSTRHVSVTEIGRQFYEACLCILADVSEAESQMFSHKEILSGSLRITAPSDIGRLHIMPVLSKFLEDNPKINPYLHLSDGIVNIAEGSFDCAIRYGVLPDSLLIARKIASNYRVLCASPDYLKRKGHPKEILELQEHDCLTMTRGSESLTHWFFNGCNGVERILIKAARSSNDGALVRRWALEGKGIALKSYLDVSEDIIAGRLIVILKEFKPDFVQGTSKKSQGKTNLIDADLHIIYSSRQYLPRRVKAFIEYLLAHFKTLEDS
jgi:DNA-binding transcriptional LysR family regulator